VAIVFSVICAIVYGASDFCGGIASRRTATFGVVVASQAVGFVLVLALMPWFGGAPQAADWFWGAMCGIAGAVALGAVVCVSRSPDAAQTSATTAARRGIPPGVLEATGAGVGFGAIFITLAQTRPAAAFSPLLVARLTTIVVIAAIAITGGSARDLRPARAAVLAVLLCGVLDVSANALYLVAVHQGAISTVAVITSLYPASTLALAAIVFGERLVRLQWAGVVMALAGVAAISAAR